LEKAQNKALDYFNHVVSGEFGVRQDVGDDGVFKVFSLNFQGIQYKRMFEINLEKFCEAHYKSNIEKKIHESTRGYENQSALENLPISQRCQ
jgi:hypothetical protein